MVAAEVGGGGGKIGGNGSCGSRGSKRRVNGSGRKAMVVGKEAQAENGEGRVCRACSLDFCNVVRQER